MATKKVWISFPLITWRETSDASVVTFLKGGLKKELEVETAAFVTKWLMDKDVPFSLNFDSSGVDRALTIGLLPKRLQKILIPPVPVVDEVPLVEVAAGVEKVGASVQPEGAPTEDIAASEPMSAVVVDVEVEVAGDDNPEAPSEPQ